MSRPFNNMFQCDQCHAYLDLEQLAGTYEVEGEEKEICHGCVEDNAVEVA